MVEILIDQIFEDIVETIREPLIVLDQDLRVVSASRSFYKVFKVKSEETVGQLIYDLGNKQWDIPKLRDLLETILPQKITFDDYEVEHDFAGIGKRIVLLNARQIERALGKEQIILVAIEDITERRQLEILLEESERRFRRLFETANDGIVLLEKREGKIAQANPAIMAMSGYSNYDFIGNDLKSVGFQNDIGTIQNILQTLEENGILHYKDAPLQKKNGQVLDTDIYMVDKASLIQCNIRDITERKRAEVESRSARSFLDSIINAIADPVFVKDDKRCFVLVNEAFCAIVGHPREDLIGKNDEDVFPEKEAEVFRKVDVSVLDTGKENVNEESLTNLSTGEVRTIITRKTCYVDPAEKRFLVGVIRDITERKRAEETLRDSEAKYRIIAENMADVISIMDMDLRFTYVSPSVRRLRGFTVEEAMEQTIDQIMTPGSLQLISQVFDEELRLEALETAAPDRSRIVELEEYKKDGSTIWVENTSSFIRDEGQKPVGIITVSRDITERKQAEEALRESEEKYRKILENIDDGYFEVDIAGNFIFFNDAMCKILGSPKDELMGKNNREYMDEKNAKKIYQTYNEIYRTGIPAKAFGWKFIRKDGSGGFVETVVSLITDSNNKGIGFRGIARDITDRKLAEKKNIRLEAQLQQSQKMEAIGTLAGGIAHDFNNILSAVLGYTELAISDLPQGSNSRDDLDEVLKASNRAKELVKQILMFSRQSENQVLLIQLHLIIEEALKLLRSSLPSSIVINQNIRALGKVFGDPTQIHQIMMNLCTNASHAMAEDGGELSVSLIKVNLPEDEFVLKNLPPGPYLKLTVSDTGCGMTPDVLNRIFEPYYTTKGIDKGTGLGLSMVHGIVQSHGGVVTVDSIPGKGTSFHIYLPEIIDPVKDNETIEQEKVIFKGTERILVVDDETPIVQMLKKTLEKSGYEVAGRTSSMDALALFKAKPDQFDLIITDMTMPHMTGHQLARQLIEIKPDIPIILCTGFHEKISEEAAKKIGIREFVMKPILQHDLSQTIRKVLDG